ncbi:hypothetical protein [Flavobacterium ginsenosidimutans]|uniref:hypothetical protein n=1 Tax=Flavobacterium ginsenosidimutans TaxID=687844 RepID=UPI003D95327E
MKETTLELYSTIFQYVIPVLQFILLIIPFLGSRAMYDKRYSNLFKRISGRGKVLFVFALILIFCTVGQSILLNKIAVLNAVNAEKNLARRDSLNRKKNEEQNLKVQEMLAKYGFSVDTKNDEIVKILRDPNLRKLTIVNGESPILDISDVSLKDNVFNFKFVSYDASSYDVNVRIDVFTDNNQNIVLLKKDLNLLGDIKIIKKGFGTTALHTSEYLARYPILFFRLLGGYKKYDGTAYTVQNYFIFNRDDNDKKFGQPQQFWVSKIKEYYENRGLK